MLRSNEELVSAAIARRQSCLGGCIFNKDLVMVLAEGVDKGSGLVAAVRSLRLTPDAVLGVGDAENDQPFLAACGLSAAVANALPSLKAEVDLVTEGAEGEGVTWLIGRLLDGALDDFAAARALSGSAAASGSSRPSATRYGAPGEISSREGIVICMQRR